MASRATGRYGGNTACVALEAPRQEPIILDLGTGLREWAATLGAEEPVRARVLLTHVHLDHVQGLPFLDALDVEGTRLDVYGPDPDGRRLGEAVDELLGPPWVPMTRHERPGEVRLAPVEDEDLVVAEAKVRVRTVPHRGATNGYRIEWGGVCIAYVSDHQAPPDLTTVDHGVLELAEGADLLIHDAQYTATEWEHRRAWGHSTVDYAVLVAREAGARRLALFHHDPDHHDDQLDHLLGGARRTAERLGVDEVMAAAEGTTVSFERDGQGR